MCLSDFGDHVVLDVYWLNEREATHISIIYDNSIWILFTNFVDAISVNQSDLGARGAHSGGLSTVAEPIPRVR